MSEEATLETSQPEKRGWWKRRSKKAKFFLIVLTLFVALIAISAAAGGGDDNDSGTSANAPVTEPQETNSGNVAEATPVVHGVWKPECNQFSVGDLDACKAVRGSKVTCQWQDENVHMSIVFKNTFSAHVTVHMNPIYKLKNAGIHGNGITSTKDVGLDPGEVRTVTVDENPAGVDNQPAITLCSPKVDVLSGVELG